MKTVNEFYIENKCFSKFEIKDRVKEIINFEHG